MRPFLLTLTFAGAVTLTSASPMPAQHTHDQRPHDQRSHAVMGFDQHKTVHRFSLYEDGGAIEVSVTDPADSANLDAIRAHLPHIAERFGAGHFEAPGYGRIVRLEGRRYWKGL